MKHNGKEYELIICEKYCSCNYCAFVYFCKSGRGNIIKGTEECLKGANLIWRIKDNEWN